MANQNGRNVAMPDENRPSWRPQDDEQRNRRNMSDDEDRYMSRDRDEDRFWEDRSSRWDRDEGYRSTERYGQGQSGYGSGRYEDDRSFQSRNMGYPAHMEERARERGLDERFSQGRGGSSWGEEGRGRTSGYGHGEYRGRGGYLGQGGQDMGRWGNEGYQGSSYGDQDRYGARGGWRGHQEGGMYGHGPGSWGQGEQHGPEHQRWGNEGYTRQGWGQQPSHRGKGPAGYQRSDERVREMVCEALSDDHNVDATNIDVTVKSGEVVLSGTVEDRMQKRMAEDVVYQVAGVKDVQNQIRVATERKPSSSKESEAATSTMSNDKKARA